MSRMFEIVLALAAGGLFVVSILLFLGGSFSAIEVATNFRPHLLAVAVVVLVVAAVLHRPAVALSLAAIVALSPSTLPYLGSGDVAVSSDAPEITVLQYNTLYLNDDVRSIADEVLQSQADVVALHEMTDYRWQDLAPLIEEEYPFHVSGLDEPLAEVRRFASILLSRSPLQAFSTDEGLAPIAAVTQLHGHDVLAVALHPSPSRTDGVRIAQRHTLLQATRELVVSHDGPALVITDLNIAPTSPEYQDFIAQLGWVDPRRDLGIAPTFPVGILNRVGIAIDHVLASRELSVTGYQLGDGGGSDHRSLIASVAFGSESSPA